MAIALNTQAISCVIRGDKHNAFKYYEKSLKLFKSINNKQGIANTLNNLGMLCSDVGDYKRAIECYMESLKIKQEIKDLKGIGSTLNNIGIIYNEQGDYSNALNYYMKSLKARVKDDKKGIASSMNNIANVYYYLADSSINANNESLTKKYSELALEYYNKSGELRKEAGDKMGLASTYINIGLIFKSVKNYEEALVQMNNSVEIYENIGNKKGLAESYEKIASVYYDQNLYAKAIPYNNKSLQLAQEIGGLLQIRDAAKSLYLCYKKTSNGTQALNMHELYIQSRDSILSMDNQKEIIRQEYLYDFEKRQIKNDAAYEKKLALEKEKKEKQQILTIATAIGLGLVGIFLFIVFNRLRITKRQKLIIEEQKEIVEDAHQEIKDSMEYAKRIQSAILPPSRIVKEYLQESFILYKPKDIVAGDFYWMEKSNDTILFAAADCTGHGVPGAMVSVICNGALNRSVREFGHTDPSKILGKAREIVIQEFEKSDEEVKDGMDIALCSLEGNILKYAGAHNPLWIIRNGEIIETKANKQPIGKFDNPEPYTTHSFELEKGDSIYIFSDGYVDQFGGEKGKKFKAKAFRELLLSIQDKSMEEQKIIIDETFETWKGNLEQIDDVCIIGVRI